MTDYTVRELMDKALDGLMLPTEDITDSVLTQAAHRRSRRRGGAVLVSAAGVAMVAGAVLVLPHAAKGAGPATLTAAPAAPQREPADPAAVVSGLLPAGSGTVVKMKDVPPTARPKGAPKVTAWPKSRFDGTYLITKDGRTAVLMIQSYDPKAKPAQRPVTRPADTVCGEIPASWKCKVTALAGGVQLIETTEPAGNYGIGSGVLNDAEVSYPDGRVIDVQALAGSSGPAGYGTPWANPPLTRAQTDAFAENPVWFT
jgi:hypothetical protein